MIGLITIGLIMIGLITVGLIMIGLIMISLIIEIYMPYVRPVNLSPNMRDVNHYIKTYLFGSMDVLIMLKSHLIEVTLRGVF